MIEPDRADTASDVTARDEHALRLGELRERAQRALDARLPQSDAPPQRLHEAMRYAVLNGGKRLRAVLVYAAGRALGAPFESLDCPACAVEMIHAYSLVHDDLPCMDDDDLRRGQPTCHRAFDVATAMLAGDALQALAFEVLTRNEHLGAPARVEMMRVLGHASGSIGMAGGQAIDLASVGQAIDLERLEEMHRKKTGALIRASIRLGALAAGPDGTAWIEKLDAYAQRIGLAFQIQDDILDVEGDTTVIGKTSGADAALNKPTYTSLLGVENARSRARGLVDEAVANLDGLGANGALLRWIADFIVNRRS